MDRRIRVGKAELPSMLIRPCSVIDDRPGEVIRPRDHDKKQQGFLYVDEHGYFVAGQRNAAARKSVHLRTNLVDRKQGVVLRILRKRIILVFAHKCGFILKFQVHGVLKCADFVVIEPRLPTDFRPGVHRFPVGKVKFSRLLKVAVCPQRLRPKFRILVPEFHVRRELVNHLGFLPVPIRMCVPVQDNVRHVARSDDCAWHDS